MLHVLQLGKTNNSSLRMLARQFRQQLLTPGLGQNPNNCEVRRPTRSSAWSEWTTPSLAPDRTIIRLGRLTSWEAGRGANNYSLFARPGSWGEQITDYKEGTWTPTPNKSESEVRIRARHTDWASPTLYASPNTPSVHAIFGVLCYHVLSSVGLYGSLWLVSCVSVQVIEILVAFPVFVLLSCYQLAHVAREPCLQAVQ